MRLLPRGTRAWWTALVALASVLALLVMNGWHVLCALAVVLAAVGYQVWAGRRTSVAGWAHDGEAQNDRDLRAGRRSGQRRSSRGLRSSAPGWPPTTTPPPSCGWASTRSTCPIAASPGSKAWSQALCWGWIDSVAQRIDEDSRRQRWTPRKPTSNWSAINIATVERLKTEGRMQPSGLAAYERRRADRSGIYSYELTGRRRACCRSMPHGWLPIPRPVPSGRSPRRPTRSSLSTVTTAKQEATRDKRLAQLLEDSAAGRLIPSQRYGNEPRWVERAAEAARAAQP